MTEVKELTLVTKELLGRLDELKNNIKKSMTVGEVNIIRGIIIFEVILKEINPEKLNDEEVLFIEKYVNDYMIKKEYEMQRVNSHIHYGINRCFLVMESYSKTKKKVLY